MPRLKTLMYFENPALRVALLFPLYLFVLLDEIPPLSTMWLGAWSVRSQICSFSAIITQSNT